MSTVTGRVKWFDENKGFGFIERPDSGEKDVFVHYRSIKSPGVRSLEDGQTVEFEIEQSDKGLNAINVMVA